MPIKSVNMNISKNQKMRFFLMSQGSLNPKIGFLGQKVCPVGCWHTDTRTDGRTHRQSDYCGHPFRVSGFYPSTYHQGSAQLMSNWPTIIYNPHKVSRQGKIAHRVIICRHVRLEKLPNKSRSTQQHHCTYKYSS